MGYEATAKSGTIVPLRSKDSNATTSANGYFNTGTTNSSSTNETITMSNLTGVTTSDYEVYITGIKVTENNQQIYKYINIQRNNSSGNFYGATSGGSSKNAGRLYTSGNTNETNLLPEWSSETNNQFKFKANVTGEYKYLKYNTSSPRFAFYNSAGEKIVFYKKIVKYTVTYDANGGTGTMTDSNSPYIAGATVTLLSNTFTAPEGKSFNGWAVTDASSNDVSVSNNRFTMPSSNVTVSAQWVVLPAYTITAASSNNSHGTVVLNGTIITATPAEGYTYDSPAYTVSSGSATVVQNGNDFTVTPTSDCTVTINFAAIPTHTATFSVNGETTSNDFYEGQAIAFPANPTAINGKSFVGWYTAEYTHATTAPSFVNTAQETMGNTDVTYYAVFADVTTTYSETETEISQTHQYDTWTYSGTTTDKSTYRLFAENAYIVSTSFDLSILKEVDVYAGTFGTISDNNKKKVSVVAGQTTWGTASLSTNSQSTKNEITSSTSLSGNGQLHIVAGGGDGSNNGIRISKVEIITKKATTTITNYSTSVVVTYSVTYDANGATSGDVPTDNTAYTSGQSVTVAGNTGSLAKTGYAFGGWNTESDGGGTCYTGGGTFNITADVTLYAVWNAKTISGLSYTGTLTKTTYIEGEHFDPTGLTITATYTDESQDNVTAYVTWTPDPLTKGTTSMTGTYMGQTVNVGGITVNATPGTAENPYTVAQALDIIDGLNDGATTTNSFYIAGIISEIESQSSNYSTGRYYISNDGTTSTQLYVYGGKYLGNVNFSENEQIKCNDIVVIYGKLQKYVKNSVTTPEIANNNYLVSLIRPASGDDPTTIAGIVVDFTVANDESYTVASNTTLTVIGTLVNNNPANLIIEEGGQLKLTNGTANVQATMKRNVAAWTGTVPDKGDEDNAGWYAIASPVNGLAISSFAQGTHNVYSYDEPTAYWHEYHSIWGESPAYNNLTSGVGYLYRSTVAGLEFKGALNAGDASGNVSPTLSYANTTNANLKGFNLVGNPFSHNISWSDMTKTDIGEGYYLLDEDPDSPTHGKWGASTTGTIAPTQAFLVKAASASASLTINNNLPAQQGKGEQANHDNIMFSVSNGSQSDETFVLFKEGYGLNKISHRNSEIPMLYVIDNGTNYAVATMPDNTQSFMLGFEAKTTGKYTLSFKANGEFNYLHVIDRMTGDDVDMLLEGEYSFIGSPMDNANRFIVRLGYLPNYDDNGEDIFAYQSGSDVVVSGEGELQIFDVMGRMIATQRINGVETINLSTNGVYIFRLNGNTQKIVVK